MGGNIVFKSANGCGKRISKFELDIFIEKEIIPCFNNIGEKWAIPKFYRNKESFGDIDILVHHTFSPLLLVNYLVNNGKMNNEDYSRNGNVISILWSGVQVDFIKCKDASHFQSSYVYFSWNDLNNLVGKIYRYMGLRFGDYGLKYEENTPYGNFEFILTTNPKIIYEFIGLDYHAVLNGFDNMEDIFKFIMSSKYFHSKMFDDDVLDARNRTRNRKRFNYKLFRENIQQNNVIDNSVIPTPWSKEFIFEYFWYTDLELEYTKFFINEWSKKNLHSKFNGKLIMMVIPELKNDTKKLSEFIRFCKEKDTNFYKMMNKISKRLDCVIYINHRYNVFLQKDKLSENELANKLNSTLIA